MHIYDIYIYTYIYIYMIKLPLNNLPNTKLNLDAGNSPGGIDQWGIFTHHIKQSSTQ